MRRLSFVVAMFVLLATMGRRGGRSGESELQGSRRHHDPHQHQYRHRRPARGAPRHRARTAQAIVDHRQKNGGFKKIEELMNVKGIGEKSFLKLKPMVTVSVDKAEKAGDR